MGERKAFGGKTIYGARVGILILETRFPRVPGDIGNALTWPFPVLYKVIRGATFKTVIVDKAKDMLEAFVAGADDLVTQGADGIATSCGYLSVIQEGLRARCPVPVASSSLMQVPFVQRLLPPGKKVGIITETDIFKAFVSVLGGYAEGIRLTVDLPDEVGKLAEVAKLIAEANGNILAVTTTNINQDENSEVTIKETGADAKALKKLLDKADISVVDLRTNVDYSPKKFGK